MPQAWCPPTRRKRGSFLKDRLRFPPTHSGLTAFMNHRLPGANFHELAGTGTDHSISVGSFDGRFISGAWEKEVYALGYTYEAVIRAVDEFARMHGLEEE